MRAALSLWVVLTCLSCDAILPQTKNPNDCSQNPELCMPRGLVCDSLSHACQDPNGPCVGSADCVSSMQVACTNAACVPCTQDSQCAAWSVERMEKPQRTRCITGGCFECRNNNECMDPLRPVCETATRLCRGCATDSECGPTSLCRKTTDPKEVWASSGVQVGACLRGVAFVNNKQGCMDMTGYGSSVMPFCTLAYTMNPNANVNANYIKLAPGNYGVANFSGSAMMSRTLIGEGRDADPANQVVFTSIIVSGSNAIALWGIQVNASGTMAPALSCGASPPGPGRGTLTLRGVSVSNTNPAMSTMGPGVIAIQTQCNRLTIENSRFRFTSPAIQLQGGTSGSPLNYRIVNNVITDSGTTNGGSGVIFGTNNTGIFAFNTLAHNYNSIVCMAPQPISDSIITDSLEMPSTLMNNLVGCGPMQSRIVTAGMQLVPRPSTGSWEPKLLPQNAMNQTCCVDKGVPLLDGSLTTDYFGATRPQGAAPDIGYHEVQ